jgi:integrase/recombinase XerD
MTICGNLCAYEETSCLSNRKAIGHAQENIQRHRREDFYFDPNGRRSILRQRCEIVITRYRRHKPTCPQFGKPREVVHKCRCKIWADGFLGGAEIRRSMDTRDWTKSAKIVQEWEAADRIPIEKTDDRILLTAAWDAIITDLETRAISNGTIRKYKLLRRQMESFSVDRGLLFARDFDLELIGKFRSTWNDAPRTAIKKLERLRAFFNFCRDRKWVEENPAAKLKQPKIKDAPTMPLTDAEMTKILTACDTYKHNVAKFNAGARANAIRVRTLILVMRYTGLRISDAVLHTADKFTGNKMFLRTAKTGTEVHTIVPGIVLDALAKTPRVNPKEGRYFWSGRGKRETAIVDWGMRIKAIFDLAEISKAGTAAVSHRFRDTFAVALLVANVPMERVSILLGHGSIKITEKSYAPWVKSRQEQLEKDIARAWSTDPFLKMGGSNQVQISSKEIN